MAVKRTIIESVRRRVSDIEPEQVFSDSFYEDAIDFALSKLSSDFATPYLDVASVPYAREFLIVKLASIEMCYMRASRVSKNDENDDQGDQVASITVPDLSVSGPASSDAQQVSHWMDLAKKLQREYDDELAHTGGMAQAATIQQAFMNRHSLTTGGLANRNMDPGLDAVSISVSVVNSTATVSWGKLLSPEFQYYEIYRSDNIEMTDESLLISIDDNDTVTYDDENLEVGTYYYRVKTKNPNDLRTNSNIVAAAVT